MTDPRHDSDPAHDPMYIHLLGGGPPPPGSMGALALEQNPPPPGEGDHAEHGGGARAAGEPYQGPELPRLPLHHPAGGPPPRAGEDRQALCLRQTPRQATSAVAYAGAEPGEDDPLLGFAPYLHPAPRSNSITPERQRRFIATLAATGIVSQAARSIGKSMEALYKLRARPGAEGFAAAWDEALERGMQRLEDCALERSLKGTPTPIVSGGKLLGTWDKPDNNLLRFMLQRRMPRIYAPQEIRPGDPAYEAVRSHVLAEQRRREPSIEEVRQEILRKVALISRHRDAEERAAREAEVAEEHWQWLHESWNGPCMPAGDWFREGSATDDDDAS